MYIRITNLEHNSRFENIQELRDSYYQEFIQSKPFFELNDNIDLRKRLGENAAEKIINNYSWNMYSEQVKNLYSKLLGKI